MPLMIAFFIDFPAWCSASLAGGELAVFSCLFHLQLQLQPPSSPWTNSHNDIMITIATLGAGTTDSTHSTVAMSPLQQLLMTHPQKIFQ
jgi:hypothetical protein